MSDGPFNPGSDEAIERGCRCPRVDNNRGKSAPWPPDGWWVNSDCPMHSILGVEKRGTEDVLGRLDNG